jgi:hypothetical protein
MLHGTNKEKESHGNSFIHWIPPKIGETHRTTVKTIKMALKILFMPASPY